MSWPASSISGIDWPSLPGRRAALMMAALQQLEDSAWWDSETLRRHQWGQITLLLAHAWETVPFYRQRLAGAGYRGVDSGADFSWTSIPVLDRRSLLDAGSDLKSRHLPAGHLPLSTITSTGSTGTAVTVSGTAMTRYLWSALTVRDHMWQGRDMSTTLAAIRHDHGGKAAYPHGQRGRAWGVAASWGFPSGPSYLLDIMTPVEDQARWLAKLDPEYLLTHPTNAEALARHCLEAAIRLPALRQVQTVSEAPSAQVRSLCQEAWNATVADTYSAQEVGYMALQCPGHEHYLVQAENVVVEVLDADGRQCGPGQVGRVVVTALHNFATPLIRYDIGDYAEVGEPSPCGRGLPVLTRILGRHRAMLTLPSGQRIWPFFGANQLFEAAPLRQIQLVQTDRDRLVLRSVVARPPSASEEAAMRTIIQERLGHPFRIDLEYPDSLPRGAGGKYEDFRSEVEG